MILEFQKSFNPVFRPKEVIEMAQTIKEGNLNVKAQTPSGLVEISGHVKVEKDGESIILTKRSSEYQGGERITILPPGSTVTIKHS